MNKNSDVVELEGKITAVLPNTLFRVVIDQSGALAELMGREVLAHLSGKMRLHYIKLVEGDRVRMEMSPRYDINKARITYRIR